MVVDSGKFSENFGKDKFDSNNLSLQTSANIFIKEENNRAVA
jgi:hypothetical protein